jgi:hypothetical protein
MVCALAREHAGRREGERTGGPELLWRACEMNMDTVAASGRDKGREWGRGE